MRGLLFAAADLLAEQGDERTSGALRNIAVALPEERQAPGPIVPCRHLFAAADALAAAGHEQRAREVREYAEKLRQEMEQPAPPEREVLERLESLERRMAEIEQALNRIERRLARIEERRPSV
ncbi:MAG: hypothetical protein HY812_14190 [Planctomycetes bacterium]|nr:hypothetical protein [Planctomycetota bacterium]